MRIKLTKSYIVENKLRFEGKPISFDKYPLTRQILDTENPIKFMIGGRQISKSMTLMEDCMSDIMGKAHFKMMYIAPQVDQVKTFSNEKIGDRISESPEFKKWYVDKNCLNNVFLKTFRNGSKILFRAETQVKSIRGISNHKVMYDEVQDLTYDNIIIIDETMSGRDNPEKWYAGTPLTINNFINTLWETSNKITPIMVCPAGHHQIPCTDNIKPDGVRCIKCNEKIDVFATYLKRMGDKDSLITGFWIPQIVLPLHANSPSKWKLLYEKFVNYPKEKFANEVMGLSAGQGVYLATKEDLMKCCRTNNGGEYDMWTEYRIDNNIPELWASIDWGITAKIGFTVLTIGGYNYSENRFQIVYAKKFLETDPLKVNDEIAYTIKRMNVKKIVADWGAGHVANRLLEISTSMPVIRVFYTGDRLVIYWDNDAGYIKASRTLTLINTFNQLRENRFLFYKWSQLEELAPHILAEYFETRDDRMGNNLLKFDHPPDKPDDFLHTINILYNTWAFYNAPHRIFV
jgi:hypothetical protein